MSAKSKNNSLKRQLSKKILKKQKSYVGGDDPDVVDPPPTPHPTMTKFKVFGDPVDVIKFDVRDYGKEETVCMVALKKPGL